MIVVDFLEKVQTTVRFSALMYLTFFTDFNSILFTDTFHLAVNMVLAAVLPGIVALGAVFLVVYFVRKGRVSPNQFHKANGRINKE